MKKTLIETIKKLHDDFIKEIDNVDKTLAYLGDSFPEMTQYWFGIRREKEQIVKRLYKVIREEEDRIEEEKKLL